MWPQLKKGQLNTQIKLVCLSRVCALTVSVISSVPCSIYKYGENIPVEVFAFLLGDLWEISGNVNTLNAAPDENSEQTFEF